MAQILRYINAGAIFAEDFKSESSYYKYTNVSMINTVHGNTLYFEDGSFTIPSTPFTSYLYRYDDDVYAFDGTNYYKNGKVSNEELIITDTGFSNVTGYISELVLFDRKLDSDEIQAHATHSLFRYITDDVYAGYNVNGSIVSEITDDNSYNIIRDQKSDGISTLGMSELECRDFWNLYAKKYGLSYDLRDGTLITTWKTASDNTSVVFPTYNGGTYSGAIDWGDGTDVQYFESYDDDAFNHTFTTAGEYKVRVTGTFSRIYLYGVTTADELIRVNSLGNCGITTLNSAFRNSEIQTFNNGDAELSDVNDCADMFYNCNSLTKVVIDDADLSNVTTMYGMFNDSEQLTDVSITNCDLSSLTNIDYMFNDDILLENLSFSGCTFGDNTISTSYTFDDTGYFTLDLSNTTFGQNSYNNLTLYNDHITSVNLSNATFTGNALINMFYGMDYLTNVDMSNVSAPNVTNLSSMFYNCTRLTDYDLTGFDFSTITNMSYMFYNCDGLTEIKFDNKDFSNVTTIDSMFKSSSNITNIEFTNCDLSSLTDIDSAFFEIASLNYLSFSGCTFGDNTISTSYTFDDTEYFTLDLSNTTFGQNSYKSFTYTNDHITSVNLSNAIFTGDTLLNMFAYSSNLTSIDMSNVDISTITNMRGMFYNCGNITHVDVTGWDISNVTNFLYFLGGTTELDADSYSDMLIQFASSVSPQTGIAFDAGNSKYNTIGEVARNTLINDHGWTFTDGGLE